MGRSAINAKIEKKKRDKPKRWTIRARSTKKKIVSLARKAKCRIALKRRCVRKNLENAADHEKKTLFT